MSACCVGDGCGCLPTLLAVSSYERYGPVGNDVVCLYLVSEL